MKDEEYFQRKSGEEISDQDWWDMAISDAKLEIPRLQSEIATLKRRKARLEIAVRIFEANKRDGIPVPGRGKKS